MQGPLDFYQQGIVVGEMEETMKENEDLENEVLAEQGDLLAYIPFEEM
jgi:hypothetical protein